MYNRAQGNPLLLELTLSTFLTTLDKTFRLGDLLVSLEIISDHDLSQALSISKETSLPLGRIFVMSNLIAEDCLTRVVRCQSLLKEHVLDLSTAKKAMDLATRSELSFDEALSRMGWQKLSKKDQTPLGELLVEGNFITSAQLEDAIKKSRKTGLPFGRMLVLDRVLSEGLLSAALNAQILIRDDKLSRAHALDALKEVAKRQIPLEKTLGESGFYCQQNKNFPRIGELLLLCGLISQTDLLNALETGLSLKKPIGEVLCESKLLSKELLDATLKTQRLIADFNLNLQQAKHIIQVKEEVLTTLFVI